MSVGAGRGSMGVFIIMFHIIILLNELTNALWHSDMLTAEARLGERRAKEDPLKAPER